MARLFRKHTASLKKPTSLRLTLALPIAILLAATGIIALVVLHAATSLVGDINGDGVVNINDLSILLSKWGTNDPNADLDHNGKVDITDLSILISHWGQTATSTPTPVSGGYTCQVGPDVTAPGNGTPYAVTVNAGARQTFKGFGTSQDMDSSIPASVLPQMWKAVFQDTKMNEVKLWVNATGIMNGANNLRDNLVGYKNDGLIAMAQQYGVKDFLVTPSDYDSSSNPVKTNLLNSMTASASARDTYAHNLADGIKMARDAGVPITVTGIMNEPDAWFQVPAPLADVITRLRNYLNQDGLQNVGIIAPESSNADGGWLTTMQTVGGNSQAWSGLLGIATHSYSMAATEGYAQLALGSGKQYWQTESSQDGYENPEDSGLASVVAARFLNDMNHGVTDWFYFLGAESANRADPNADDMTHLATYDTSSGNVFYWLKLYYLQQLRTVFDFGMVFRHSTSASEGEMNANGSDQATVHVAAGRNADGTWAASVGNRGGQAYNVNLDVKELEGVPSLKFAVYRSSRNNHVVFTGLATMTNGKLTLTVNPGELVSIRACTPQ